MVSIYEPAGDQPQAIAELAAGLEAGEKFQTLLGITGSGKSATIGWTIEKVQRPTLVIAPNKSLAAQLASEFKEFFPKNRVEYFVVYYDYYQPEAYLPSSDTFIEKDSSINDEIDRLRHSTTSALLARRDVIVVASVSCIYGLGSPEEYASNLLLLKPGETVDQRAVLRKLVDIGYDRNDANLVRGKFRVRGDVHRGAPRVRRSVGPHRVVRRRGRAAHPYRSGHRRDPRGARRPRGVAGHALRHRQRAAARSDRAHRRRAAEAPGVLREGGQAARGAAAADAHPVRPRDDARGRLLQRHRELLSRHLDGRSRGRAAVDADRLLPGRLPARDRREPRHRAAAARPVRGRPLAQGNADRSRLPPAVGGATTARCASTSSPRSSTRSSSCRPRRRRTRSSSRRGSSSRSCGPPA